ncbi:MAG TPA: PepSY domain-containing protein [Pseudobacillus sp.]
MKLKEKMNGLFKKNEKWILAFISMFIVATAGLGIYIGIYFTAEKAGEMTREEAEAVVREDFDGEVLSFERDWEWELGSPSIMKMTIKTDNNYEEIEMDASNGKILRREADHILSSLNSPVTGESSSTAPAVMPDVAKESSSTAPAVMPDVAKKSSSTVPAIVPEEAIELALDKVTGDVKEIELDAENHKMVYEIEIEEGSREHNVHVDAMTGSILMVGTES